MTMNSLYRSACAGVAVVLAGSSLGAQGLADGGLHGAPQFVQYQLQAPTNLTISEFSFPLFAIVPVSSALNVDVGTAYAQAKVEQTGAAANASSTISGLTDTQIRANYTFGSDFVVLTAGMNLPTGKATVKPAEILAAGLIGNDFLAFPISYMGTGLGATGGIAVAHPLNDWNWGFGLSMRRSADYQPFDAQTGQPPLRFQPGNEYRLRAGVDRPVGTGQMSFALTYSKFGNDNMSGSIYNTGDRFIAQAGYANTYGPGDLSLSAWNMFRGAGTLADSSALGHENLTNIAVAYSVTAGAGRFEPTVELRNWIQDAASTSMMASIGVRYLINIGGFGFAPSAGFTLGKLASQTAAGASTTASLSGFRAALAIRMGQ